MARRLLTETQWKQIEPILARAAKRKRSRAQSNVGGRPRQSDREVFTALLWMLMYKRPWRDLPRPKYPSYSTCRRRLKEWREKLLNVQSEQSSPQRKSVWDMAWLAFIEAMDKRTMWNWKYSFGFSPSSMKKGRKKRRQKEMLIRSPEKRSRRPCRIGNADEESEKWLEECKEALKGYITYGPSGWKPIR